MAKIQAQVRSADAEASPTADSDLQRWQAHPLTPYYMIALSAGALLLIGLVMVLSASSVTSFAATGSFFSVFDKQLMWFAVGLPLLWVASRTSVTALRRFAYPALAVALVLMALVPLIGVSINGNRNWLVVGGFSIQPSEVAKLALIVWGADLIARKHALNLLGDTKHLLVPLLPVAMAIVGLHVVGSDLGSALVLMAITFALLYFAGTPLAVLLGLGAGAAGLVAVVAVENPTRIERLTSFLHPGASSALGTGYQLAQAKLALGSGGLFGVGLGASREKWGLLPEASNDTIFAVIGEELGLIGTLAVLALFAVLIYAALRVALRTDDMFVRLAASGIAIWLAVQTLINVGTVTGLAPVIGLPLPLISYGGSALVVTMIAIGILLALARSDPAAQAALRSRRWGGRASRAERRARRDVRGD